jgi:hypothetical protein
VKNLKAFVACSKQSLPPESKSVLVLDAERRAREAKPPLKAPTKSYDVARILRMGRQSSLQVGSALPTG